MLSDRLRATEVAATERAFRALRDVQWAQPLLRRLERAGGITPDTKPIMFEVRVAFEIHRAGAVAEYEHRAGVGDSTVDFRVVGRPDWLIEIVSIRASEAVKRATQQTGLVYVQQLSSSATDPAQSEEAEIITVQQKIAGKVTTRNEPTKFPVPRGCVHVVLADMRGFMDNGGDPFDYREIAYGWRGIPNDQAWIRHSWNGRPIKGLFEEENPLKGAPIVQQRIHFLGFICETDYHEGEIPTISYYLANWHLFASQAEARTAFATCPVAVTK